MTEIAGNQMRLQWRTKMQCDHGPQNHDDSLSDETARENKDAIVKRLELLGACDIIAAESLSFVTASIPVTDVLGFSLHEEMYAVGDGELPVISDVDTARHTIHATSDDIRLAIGKVLDGMDVLVAVVDTGINSIYLNDKVTDRIYSDNEMCEAKHFRNTNLSVNTGYKFRVAAINSVGTGTYSAIVSANTKSSCPSNYIVINTVCNSGKVTVSGHVFRDTNLNGIKDFGEGGVNRVFMKAFAGGWDNGVNVHGNELKSTRTTVFTTVIHNHAVVGGFFGNL